MSARRLPQLAPRSSPDEGGAGEAIDPICGMTVDPATAKFRAEHAGRTFYFCAEHCLHKFEADPARYVDPAPVPKTQAPTASVSASREYVCPMHPEVVQCEPGSCPICGMALEPRFASAEEEASPELDEMMRRLRV